MRYTFTGTHKNYNHKLHDPILREVISQLTDGEEFISGAAYGVDHWASLFSFEFFPNAKQTIVVPSAWHDEYYVSFAELHFPNVEIIHMPKGTDYRVRNLAMVSRCDKLLAFPLGKLEKPRSGTWMTVNIAKNMGVPFEVFNLPSPKTTSEK